MSLKKNLIILVILSFVVLWFWKNDVIRENTSNVVRTYKIGVFVDKFIPDFLYLNLFEEEDSEWENTWNNYLKSYGEDEENE